MNEQQLVRQLARQLKISEKYVAATIALLQDGATIPFIARYRKEATGSLNEVQIAAIRDGIQLLRDIEKRRSYILTTIEEQGKLTTNLATDIKQANSLNELEDLYLPYKPKRRTKATIAREKGLEPLAQLIMQQKDVALFSEAQHYVNEAKGVANVEEAIAGARDVIAENINENIKVRQTIRQIFKREAYILSKLVKSKEEKAGKFEDYFDYQEAIRNIPSHRFLAIMRGVNEGVLRFKIEADEDFVLEKLDNLLLKNDNTCTEQVETAITDAYKRLIRPSIETEFKNILKEKADKEAIQVFTENLRELLMASPLGSKATMGIDPGFRTGCKVVCLDKQGQLLENTTVFPHGRNNMQKFNAITTIENLVKKYAIEAIAVGNGTAGRETLSFVKKIGLQNVNIVMVNESGASIYSASELAREEFPDKDLTVRGAVSIGRRLMDPLAELVKIDPKSIGVGQYQHDVDQQALRKSLDDTVMSCVNQVGVAVNTASKQLLTYLSGVGPKLAQNIVAYRNEHGAFTTKKQLVKVKGLGAKAFEQAAGFIRINGANNPLDSSAVHPERYELVGNMAKDLNCTISDLVQSAELREQINLQQYISNEVGLPTLNDILAELAKPGRDPRQNFEAFDFKQGIDSIDDLEEGIILPGIVTNVTNFGAFVDVGVHQDGLVHISQIANKFVKDPRKVLKVNQKVRVKVINIDTHKKRIQLSIKQAVGGDGV